MKAARTIGFIAMFAIMHAARAVILYDTGTDTDNTYNQIIVGSPGTYPSDGAPWQYVAQVINPDDSDASAVYLGNGFLITANHVNLEAGGSIVLDGTSYTVNFSYTPVQLGLADLKLFEINGNPGLAPMTLTGTTTTGTADLNMASTMVGWGVGKGSVISGEGWTWGDGSTYAQRWGTNMTLTTYGTDNNNVVYLQTAFNTSLGPNTYSASLGDSGSGLFQEFSGTWELAGVYVGVDTSGASYYADSPNNPSGMDYSYAVEIEPYTQEIESDIPEPGSVALIGLGAGALVFCARLRRRKRARGGADPGYIRPRFL